MNIPPDEWVKQLDSYVVGMMFDACQPLISNASKSFLLDIIVR